MCYKYQMGALLLFIVLMGNHLGAALGALKPRMSRCFDGQYLQCPFALAVRQPHFIPIEPRPPYLQ